MARTLASRELAALARGFALLGSGGGGATGILESMLADAARWPITVLDADELDPSTPCLGAAFVGSTILLGERLPGADPFGPLIAAVERWLGTRIPAVCSLEGGGLNGLIPLLFAGERVIVDADCTGRAVPGLDQMSLFVDRVPGIAVAADTGAGGVMLMSTGRAIDLERVIRSAIVQAGGVGGAVFSGFTVGDLREHAVTGNLARALELGRAYLAASGGPVEALALALGGRLLAQGRVSAIVQDAADPFVHTIELDDADGVVHRLVTRSESLALVTDGRLVSSAPAILVVLDALSRDVLEVTEIAFARPIAVIELPAPGWWHATPERVARVRPSAYGLSELDPVP